jgi:acetylornithine deacetylase
MNSQLDPEALLLALLRYDTVSAGENVTITDFLGGILQGLGFELFRDDYVDPAGVTKANLIATRYPLGAAEWSPERLADRGPEGKCGVAYFAHTDVVPAYAWQGPGGPFDPMIVGERIYGRGSCDMKGSLVAMIVAASRIRPQEQTAPIRIACAADEEIGFIGAKRLVSHSQEYRRIVQEQPIAIIGEPTRCQVVHAHKGIEAFRISSLGRAAHSSSREGLNANLAMVPMLVELLRLHELTETDPALRDERFDPPTVTWTFGVSDHCTAVNITPGRSDAWVSFRTMPEIDTSDLVAAVASKAEQLGLSFSRKHGGPPLWVAPDHPAVRTLCQIANCQSPRTVCYATDGGEYHELLHRVVWGPGDIAQAHTSDEWLHREQLAQGIDLYHQALVRWCV